jgi:glycosyltransferase involved in cell wall biosynthesis
VRPDIIHTHTAKAGTVGRAAAIAYKYFTPGTLVGRPRKVKIVHTFHGHVFHSYYSNAKTRLFILIEKALGRFATDKIITITDQQFSEIHKTFGIGKADQFEVIPLGIDLTAFTHSNDHRSVIRESLGISADAILVGFVGRLTEIKNLSMFLKVAGETLREDSRIRFVIIGDGHLRKELELEASNLGIAEKVRFLGNRTDTAALYNALDIVALTSLNEGTPLSLIEAMAAARPVISTKVGGVSDLLGETISATEGFEICERGISAPSNDVATFTKGLIYLAKNEKLRESIGDQGRNFVNAKYSKDRLIADIKQLYKRLAA